MANARGSSGAGQGGGSLSEEARRIAEQMQAAACPAQESSLTATETYNANNQISDGLHQYDAAGDLTQDATTGNQYLYDGEGRICAVASTPVPGITAMTGYLYDAEGNRVAKGSITSWSCNAATNGFQPTTEYITGAGGEQLSELGADGHGNMVPQRTYVYQGGAMMATYDFLDASSSNPYGLRYRVTDWLGTLRALTDNEGVPEGSFLSLPFGEQAGGSGNVSDPHWFTSKERDQESGNDYFGARYYASSMGRFLSPDPVIVTPDRLKDPQQLNLYAYVRNNPIRLVDPTGEILECTGDNKADCFSTLQQLAGDYANRLSMDAKTGIVSFDTTGLDLKGDEGATLVNQLVGSSNTYGFAVGATIDTAQGPVKVADTANLPPGMDQTQIGKPIPGITDQVVVNPNAGLYDSNGKLVTTESLAFHELAEAYAKVDEGRTYSDPQFTVVNGTTIKMGSSEIGAHHEAVIREDFLRDQRPSLTTTGRAGDKLHTEPQQIIRNPH